MGPVGEEMETFKDSILQLWKDVKNAKSVRMSFENERVDVEREKLYHEANRRAAGVENRREHIEDNQKGDILYLELIQNIVEKTNWSIFHVSRVHDDETPSQILPCSCGIQGTGM